MKIIQSTLFHKVHVIKFMTKDWNSNCSGIIGDYARWDRQTHKQVCSKCNFSLTNEYLNIVVASISNKYLQNEYICLKILNIQLIVACYAGLMLAAAESFDQGVLPLGQIKGCSIVTSVTFSSNISSKIMCPNIPIVLECVRMVK